MKAFIFYHIFLRWRLSKIALLFFIWLIVSCGSNEKEEQEAISNLPLPAQSHVVESYDDQNFVQTITLAVDSVILKDYVKANGFEKFTEMHIPKFWSANNLKETKPDFSDLSGFYFKSGINEKNAWIYIADMKRNLLWAEIKHQKKAY